MLATPSTSTGPRNFVYISAADCFRPLIPAKYIETKRQAEFGIRRRVEEHPESRITPSFIRPGTSERSLHVNRCKHSSSNHGVSVRLDVSPTHSPNLDITRLCSVPLRLDPRHPPHTQSFRFQVVPRRCGRRAADTPAARRPCGRGHHQGHRRREGRSGRC